MQTFLGLVSKKALLDAYSYQGDPDDFDANKICFRPREKPGPKKWDMTYCNSNIKVEGTVIEKTGGGHDWNASVLATMVNPSSYKVCPALVVSLPRSDSISHGLVRHGRARAQDQLPKGPL